MAEKLSEAEIHQRLQRLRNYERLYPQLREKYEAEREKNQRLRMQVRAQEKRIEGLLLRIEKLETMIFGRKKKGREASAEGPMDEEQGGANDRQRKKRSPSSYRRPAPRDVEVTAAHEHPLGICPDCGTPLEQLEMRVRFVEDIVLPAAESNPLKTVEKHAIGHGYCPHCRKTVSALPLPTQVSVLGENVRAKIVQAITVLGQTFSKVQWDLEMTFGIHVSKGEITTILTEEARKLLPEYHDIARRIRDGPAAHYDETGYPVQEQEGAQGNFGWVKAASHSPDVLFLLGRSRGKGNAEELRGERSDQVGITDGYGAYRTLFPEGKHALCWSHPKTKFEELAKSSSLPTRAHRRCQEFYGAFCQLYKDAQVVHSEPYDAERRQRVVRETFLPRIAMLFAPRKRDPATLATLKESFLADQQKYMVSLLLPDIPMDNNKAERAIRSVVIKRKNSYGSRTQKGADVMSILLSVCATLWGRHRQNFFAAYRQTIDQWALDVA